MLHIHAQTFDISGRRFHPPPPPSESVVQTHLKSSDRKRLLNM